jgi:hypothetical protein
VDSHYLNVDPVLNTNFFPYVDPPDSQMTLRLPPFHFDPDSDPAFHFDPDPDPDLAVHLDPDSDPASQNDADPCRYGSATLLISLLSKQVVGVATEYLF